MKYYYIGYGSLMSHKSLSKTIRDRNFKPVLVDGFKRIFNVDLNPNLDENLDVLNVEKNNDNYFNGILIEINRKELDQLKKREKHYIFEKVKAKDFFSGETYENCILSIDYFNDIDLGFKQPKENYFNLCRNAAYNISKEFGEVFDETTFTSNGKVIKDFLIENPDY